jgi:hypothetical protein
MEPEFVSVVGGNVPESMLSALGPVPCQLKVFLSGSVANGVSFAWLKCWGFRRRRWSSISEGSVMVSPGCRSSGRMGPLKGIFMRDRPPVGAAFARGSRRNISLVASARWIRSRAALVPMLLLIAMASALSDWCCSRSLYARRDKSRNSRYKPKASCRVFNEIGGSRSYESI